MNADLNGALRILFLEDSAIDADLVARELKRHGLVFQSCRVQTRDALCEALEDFAPDVVLSDLTMPGFSGIEGLRITREMRTSVPFIYVSGTIGEERAVELLKKGATDYVLKQNLTRLAPAVERALQEAEERSEWRRVEERLRKLSSAVEHCPAAIVITDVQGRIEYVNPKFVEITGYSADEVAGQNPRVLKSGENPVSLYEDLWKTILAGKVWRGEFHNLRKNGEPFWESASISPVQDDTGAVTHFVAVKEDITERKIAEGKIRSQAHLLDLAQDAILVRDFQDRRIVYWNKSAERIYGWSADEALGRDMCECLMTGAEDERMAAALAEKGEWHGELQQVRKSGTEITVSSRATLVRNAKGEAESVLVINTDITQQKKLEAQFLRAQRLESIGTLASGVAHDLNNILAPIMMSTPLLRGDLTPEMRHKIVDTIDGSARRGRDIVKQVLTFARGIDGQRLLIDPAHLIKEMRGIAQETFPKSIKVSARFGDRMWPVSGDPTQLHQVVLNLTINARDAMPDGGNLLLSCENFALDEHYASMMPGVRPGNYVLLKVTDTGHGIPPGLLERIFDPFFTTKEVGQGTGLGLSTTIGIVKSHGGFINVYSEPCKGTTFKVFLPAAPGASTEAAETDEDTGPRGHGELVLVVDDEAGIRMMNETVLREAGYDVVTADDGTQAVALYMQHRERIAVVLTDVVMPYFDGMALTRALKRIDPALRIIASSGQGDPGRVAALAELGVHAFLPKPYHAANLLSAVHWALARPGKA